MSDAFEHWLATEYKELWHQAYDAGVKARNDGKPRTCDLSEPFAHKEAILKVYRSAWEQGWDGWTIPSCFTEMEKALQQTPVVNWCRCPDESQVIWDGFGGGQCQRCKGHTF